MAFPQRFSNLPTYAFPRLRALLDTHASGGDVVHMSIGEPKHPYPDWVSDVVAQYSAEFGLYPPNSGTPALRAAISTWLSWRFGISADPDQHVVALNGTREGLFNACVALCPEQTRSGGRPRVLIPNPFYQVYAVAAAAVSATAEFIPAFASTGSLPDYCGLDPKLLEPVEIAFLCSPSNPQGAVASREYLIDLINLAEQYDFRIFADECYSEIYRHDAPLSALQVAREIGADPERVLIFHSLSKRSNLPGLRSGFVAGGAQNIARIKQLRDFSGAPQPLPIQHVSEKIWADEAHVIASRALYHDKYQIADQVFASVPEYSAPEAGFFLWLPVEDGEAATLKLWQQTGVRVLPGAYLGRDVAGGNPGEKYIRVAMVAPKEEMQRGLIRLRDCLYT